MPSRPLLLGHRGARATRSVAENTIASFDLALRHGCDGFEFDVRLTADGRAVVCHDPQVSRREIASAHAGELATLPTLQQVLGRYGGRAFLDIELKVPGLEALVSSEFRQVRFARGAIVSSFLPEVLHTLSRIAANFPLGLICETRQQLQAWRELPVQYVVAHHALISQALVDDIHAAQKSVFVWTVNDPAMMREMNARGVDAVIADDTETLVKTLGHDGEYSKTGTPVG
jgi:glycerophosphoryl diester phosphodiesterase